MKIVIDARLYGLEHAGPGRYVKNLVDALVRIDKKNSYVILLRERYFNTLNFPSNFQKELTEFRHYTFSEQTKLPSLIRKHHPDLVHFPFFNVPLLYFGKFIVTIHDLTMHFFKGGEATTRSPIRYLIWRMGYHLSFLKSVYFSQAILVPSDYVRDTISSFYKINTKKIITTYEGVDEDLKIRTDPSVLKKYDVNIPYIIYSGSAYPHKNLQRAISAVKKVNEVDKTGITFILTSSRSIFHKRLKQWTKELKATKYVRYLGFVPDRELASLFALSLAYIYPTLSEGFGLPGLEALQAGTILLSSDISVLREVYRNNAVFFDPKSTESIKKSIIFVHKMNITERKNKIKSYAKLLRSYSWNKMATLTLSVYESLR